jgi:tryptophan synthase alpha chain
MASALATTTSDAGASPAGASAGALARRFADLRGAGRRALVCYVTAGHPDPERSVELLRALEGAGADVLEVGLPFSDPMADGPVIQASSQRALQHGVTFDSTLELISRARLSVPVVLFSYLNPLLAAGPDALARAADAGAHGVLVTDLPVGADPEREAWLGGGPLAFVRLVAPTTPPARMAEIARHGSGFVYLISRLGVTGARDHLPADLPRTVATLRAATTLPICVGFGVSRPEHARAIGTMADGVVVGSAIVRAADSDVAQAAALARSLREALDG